MQSQDARQWEYNNDHTFRWGPVEVVKDSYGNKVNVRECQVLIEGRWEPFLTDASAFSRK